MHIDLEHLHYWMQAIRQSPDPTRTMDAFWSGQLQSKQWLITNLRGHIKKRVDVDIYGGWVGVLASMLFQSDVPVATIRSIDIDPGCESIAVIMNKIEQMTGRFCAITADMCKVRSDADVIINTSCEHITQDQFDTWKRGMPYHSLLVLQSNDFCIQEHIRTAASLQEFKKQCGINVIWAEEMKLPLYNRFMIIGNK